MRGDGMTDHQHTPDLLGARLTWITLPVTDLAGMTAWYRETLGLPLERTDERAAYFRLGEVPFELYWSNEHARPGEPLPLWLFWEVEDLEATRRDLAARGVVTGEVVVESWGRWSGVTDPEGNEWRLTSHNPEAG
jgi:predicted enzyme related to lactoylglutathione lyase